MALDTYDELKASVIDHLAEAQNLNARFDEFLRSAHDKLRVEVRSRSMEKRADFSLALNATTSTMPTDFLDLNFVRVLAPTGYGRRYLPDICQVTTTELTECATTHRCRPTDFAVIPTGTGWELEWSAPADQAYTGQMIYYQELAQLSASTQTNPLFAEAPSVYLYATLLEAEPYLMNDDRVALWRTQYENLVEKLNRHAVKAKRGRNNQARVPGLRFA